MPSRRLLTVASCLAWTIVAATLALIVWGGVVHVTESSLACPDWPLCFDQIMPEMTGKVAVEHGHRMLATGVGLLTIVLAVLCWLVRPARPGLRLLGSAALLLVVGQGLLGGLTVLYRLPTLVSTAHLATSMAYLSLVAGLALHLRPLPMIEPDTSVRRMTPWLVATAGAIWVQIVLGALVRHTGSGLACNTTILLCRDALWPTGPGTAPAQLQMVHRAFGLTVAILVIAVGAVLFRRAHRAGAAGLAALALAGPCLVVTQVTLGIYTVKTYIGLATVSAHLAVGALLLVHHVAVATTVSASRQADPGDPEAAVV